MSSQPAEATPRRLLPIMAVLILVEIMSSLEANMIFTAMPSIARELGGMQATGWLISAFALVQAASAAIGGRLGDLYGRRRVILIVCVICALGSAISALHTDLRWIIAGRAIQGASGAILPLCYGIVRQLVPQSRLPFWIGVFAGAYAASGAIGFLVGGALSEYVGWHAIFYVTTVLPLLLIAPTWLVVPALTPARDSRPLDVLGGVLFVAAISGVLIALTYGKSWGWVSPRLLALLAASLAIGALWVWHERRAANPLIDIRLLQVPDIALGNLCFFLFGLGAMQMPLVVMMLIQQPAWTGIGLGVGATLTGLLKLPSSLVGAFAGPFSGYLATRRDARFAAIVGAALTTAGWILVSLHQGSLGYVFLTMVMMGFGSSMVLAAVTNIVVAAAPAARASEATGLASVTRTIGLAAGAQLAAVLLSTTQIERGGSTFPAAAAYGLTFWSLTAIVLGAFLVALCFPAVKKASQDVGEKATAPGA